MVTFSKLGKLGRFGNQLFQYSGTRLYAELNGYKSAFPHWIGSDIFKGVNSYSFKQKKISQIIPTIQFFDLEQVGRKNKIRQIFGLWKKGTVEELYKDPRDNINFFGYMQDSFSIDQLLKNKEKVLEWFRFSDDVEKDFTNATKQYGNWSAVHIRRGDFKKRGIIIPIEPYVELVSKLPVGTKLFVSDEKDEVRGDFSQFNLIKPENPRPDLPDFVFDFWMFSKADVIYGSGSTFAWWAAYIGNKNNYFSPPSIDSWKNGQIPKIEKQQV
jgi:hypothetical protein